MFYANPNTEAELPFQFRHCPLPQIQSNPFVYIKIINQIKTDTSLSFRSERSSSSSCCFWRISSKTKSVTLMSPPKSTSHWQKFPLFTLSNKNRTRHTHFHCLHSLKINGDIILYAMVGRGGGGSTESNASVMW